jgi:D-xylose 1-dehydrogenase (NADP+, D-xylono-1,5-lactone-forming)
LALRLGLLSTARINREILAAAAATDRAEVVAVASRDRARAEAYTSEHGIPAAHGSYEGMLADDEVDAVYIPLPNGLHHEWTMRALAAGKHVLCEKPYSRRPAEVEEAFDLAAESGLVLMEAFMYRHHPQSAIVAELVSGGALGRLRTIRATFGFALADPRDPRLSPELDGGSLMDVGCYGVNVSRLLADEPVRVVAEQVVGATGVDVAFFGTLRFPDDVIAQIDCSFETSRAQRLEVRGDEASLVVEAPFRLDWGWDVRLQRNGEADRVEVPEASSFQLELENLADAVAGTAEPRLGRADALGQARTIEALYRAAESGASVAL